MSLVYPISLPDTNLVSVRFATKRQVVPTLGLNCEFCYLKITEFKIGFGYNYGSISTQWPSG